MDTADNILQNNLGKKEVQAFLNISIARAFSFELQTPPRLGEGSQRLQLRN